MGLDGGSIPLRIELCKAKQKEEVADKAATRQNRFFTCAVSGLPLCAPVVVCATGRLYSYEQLLLCLTAKPRRQLPPELAHLRSKRDVFSAKFARNPAYDRPPSDPVDPDPVSPWICPVTAKEIGKTPERFVAARECGCVVAHSLLAMAPNSNSCFNCGAQVSEFVELIPPEEIANEIVARLAEERANKKESKKQHKKNKPAKSDRPDDEKKAEESASTKKRKTEPNLTEIAAQKASEKTSRVSSLFSAEGFKAKSSRDLFYNITTKK